MTMPEPFKKEACPLCLTLSKSFFKDSKTLKLYFKCEDCSLVFLAKDHRLSLKEEKARYDFHQNSPDDPEYRKFLSQLYTPLLEKLEKKDNPKSLKGLALKGLDYGCGPNPALSVMFQECGIELVNYDPIYFPLSEEELSRIESEQFDFITCTEAAEHFYYPNREFEKISKVLKPGGIFALMTLFLDESQDFESWYYRRDLSHVVFYSKSALTFVSKKYFSAKSKPEFFGERTAMIVKE